MKTEAEINVDVPLLIGTKVGRSYPDRGRLGAAWPEAYTRLHHAGAAWTDGVELAKELAEKHELNPNTLIALFTRMATAGLLERRAQDVTTGRGVRRRTHYRVPQKG